MQLKQKYVLHDDIIGKGTYGTIKLVQNVLTHKVYACKILPKYRDFKKQIEKIEREVSIWKQFQGVPNVCPLIETLEDTENYYLVQTHNIGGTMHEFIKSEHNNERNLKVVVKQILKFLETVHKNDIVYGDIKCHNVMFLDQYEKNLYINMIDFGCSKRLDGRKYIHGIQGTPYFFPPEFMDNYITTKSDLWALGILIYYAIVKKYPILSSEDCFKPGDLKKYIHKINTHKFEYAGINNLYCKDFLLNLFKTDPDYRMTAVQALEHPWLQSF